MRPLFCSLFQFLENVAEVDLLGDDAVELLDLDALLLHRITMTDGNATVVERVMVDSDAERSSDRILTAVSLTD